jgi:hypothetical protein
MKREKEREQEWKRQREMERNEEKRRRQFEKKLMRIEKGKYVYQSKEISKGINAYSIRRICLPIKEISKGITHLFYMILYIS